MSQQPHEIWAQMRTSFATQLPQRLTAIALAIEQLVSTPTVQHIAHLRHLLHNLVGAAGTFGLPMLSLSARNMDNLLESLLQQGNILNPSHTTTIQEAFNDLKSCTENTIDTSTEKNVFTIMRMVQFILLTMIQNRLQPYSTYYTTMVIKHKYLPT